MAPQKFADLGKEARDLISKNFHFSTVKLETKTTTKSGIDFKTEGSHDTDTGNVVASLETKFKLAPYGLTITKKWNTDNVIAGTIGVENKLIDGLKVDLDGSYAPVTGQIAAKIKTAYACCDYVHATADVASANFTAPTLNFSNVFAYQGWHVGYQASYDTASSKLIDNNVNLTYKTGATTVHAGIVNASKFLYSVHHEVNKNLSVAGLLQGDPGSSNALTVCGQYALDDDTFVKAKVDNNMRVGLSYVQSLSQVPGLQVTLSGLVFGKALDQGGHRIGMHLNFGA